LRPWCKVLNVLGVLMKNSAFFRLAFTVFLVWWGTLHFQSQALSETSEKPSGVCCPALENVPPIELGKGWKYTWNCEGTNDVGHGFYIVFIRPSGTYVLLKVAQGANYYEFTPDASGQWRWIVINTDPDRSKPDVESEPGHFEVVDPVK
jgi:hypothetical protein